MKAKVEIFMQDEKITIQKGLKSFSCSENLKGSDMDLVPGYIEQNAEIAFFDLDNTFRDKMRENKSGFFSKRQINIYMDDELLGVYLVDRIDASFEENEVKIYCVDYSYTFENALTTKSNIMTTATPKQLLDYIFNNSLSEESYVADSDALTLMNNITVYNAYLLNDTIKDSLNKICAVGCVNMFYDKGVFRIARCF